MADEQNAASSPAIVPAVEAAPETIPLENFTSEQRTHWLKTGESPAAPKVSSELPALEAGTKPAPASEPGIEQEPKLAPGEKRKGQLANEIQQLLRQRAEIRQGNERMQAERARNIPASQAGTPAVPAQSAALTKPKVEDFQSWEEYETAKDNYYEQMAESKATAAVEADRQQRASAAQAAHVQEQNQKIESDWSKRTREFKASHPDAKEFDPAVAAMVDSGLIPENSFLDQWILNSDYGPALAWHFSQNPDEILRIGELHPIASARELAKLENSFEIKATVPVPRQQAVTPKPPVTVSARATGTADEVEAALQSDDARPFINAMNRRELAASRKG